VPLLVAVACLTGCDVASPTVLPSPTAEVSHPESPPVIIPSPSPVRPPQSPPAGAPAPD